MGESAEDILIQIDRQNAINCTGLGEVGCHGRDGWHSWSEHRHHVAEAQIAALVHAGLTRLADPTVVEAVARAVEAHTPSADWHCRCGEDMFGGTAAYTRRVHGEHQAAAVLAAVAAVLVGESA